MKNYIGRIKVSQDIYPIAPEKREIPNLLIGGSYHISFGNNSAYPCKLVEIKNQFERKEATVEVPMKSQSKNGYIDANGNLSHDWKSVHAVYADEIGESPEHAVENAVG